MNMLFYIFFGTNLLTQCQVPASVFSCFWPIFRRSPNGMKLYDDFFGPKETPEALEEGQKSHEGVTSPDAATTP